MSTVVVTPGQQIESHRNGAEAYAGDSELCRRKTVELLDAFHLPLGLLPLEDIEEVGHNKDTGFVWLRQRRKKDHAFRKINRQVTYAPEVTAFVEDRRMRRITGVKSKELLIWLTINDICVDQSDPTKITFKTPSGLYRTFPAAAFEPEDNDYAK